MSVKISGDFESKINNWTELLNDAKVIVSHSTRAAAEVAIALVGEGFEDEEDPYGEKWQPKKKSDGRKILHGVTSRLRTGWHVEQSDDSFTIVPAVEYAAYHQQGAGRLPQRMMVPSGARGLPRKWVEEFEAIAAGAFAEHFAAASVEAGGVRTPAHAPAVASATGGRHKRAHGGATGANVRSKVGAHAASGSVRSKARRKNRGGTSFGGVVRKIRRLARLAGVE